MACAAPGATRAAAAVSATRAAAAASATMTSARRKPQPAALAAAMSRPAQRRNALVRAMNLCISHVLPRSQLYDRAAVRRALAPIAVVVSLAGCGSAEVAQAPPPAASTVAVALLDAPRRPGEIVVRGEASPASHGPSAFRGRYVVRFEQYAPEAPRMDFGAQTAFVADLDRRAQQAARGSIRLFRAASRTGRRTITLEGRYFVDVSFGD